MGEGDPGGDYQYSACPPPISIAHLCLLLSHTTVCVGLCRESVEERMLPPQKSDSRGGRHLLVQGHVLLGVLFFPQG